MFDQRRKDCTRRRDRHFLTTPPSEAETWKLPMYEASFGLKRRPFAATPDATCFLSAGPIQAALDEIVVCVEQGQGIAVLTAPAGTGKTLLCERLCSELSDRFQIAFLRHSSFLTRRALLQTLLSELNHPYQHPSEQELRLELLPAIRGLRPERDAFVVICDEAHHLSENLIEELRILADLAESGRPLVRLVLVGQLPLEEKLAQPGLEAFNQRIRAHVNLPTFDQAGSLDYIDYRLTWGGGRTEELFTPAALDLIARASDGIPRCINQLADHSLLLAFVAEQRPVGEEIVFEALNDLRRLPLHWNEFSRSSVATSEEFVEIGSDRESTSSAYEPLPTDSNSQNATYSYESEVSESESDVPTWEHGAFEVGAEVGAEVIPMADNLPVTAEVSDPAHEIQIDVGSDDWKQTVSLFAPSQIDVGVESAAHVAGPVMSDVSMDTTGGFQEEFIVDRYTSIDAGLPPVAISVPDKLERHEVRAVTPSTDEPPINSMCDLAHIDRDDFSDLDAETDLVPLEDDDVLNPATEPLDHVLGAVRDLIDLVSEHKSHRGSEMIDSAHPISPPAGMTDLEGDSILKALRRETENQDAATESDSVVTRSSASDPSTWEAVETEVVEATAKPRPYRYLFSMLRRKQQQTT